MTDGLQYAYAYIILLREVADRCTCTRKDIINHALLTNSEALLLVWFTFTHYYHASAHGPSSLQAKQEEARAWRANSLYF